MRRSTGRPLLYITKFVNALFPDKSKIKGMTALFHIL